MVLQLEDIAECLDALYSLLWDVSESPHNVFVKCESHPRSLLQKYELIFLRDHSCGNYRKCADDLDVTGLRRDP